MDARTTSSIPNWAMTLELVSKDAGEKAGEGQALTALIAEIDGEVAAAGPDRTAVGGAEGPGEAWQALRFSLGDGLFVVPTAQLVELAPVPEITTVPGLPNYVRGLAHFRGQILAVIDLSVGASAASHMVVVRGAAQHSEDDWLAGVLIESSHGIIEISAYQMQEGVYSAATLFDKYMIESFVLGTVPLDGREVAVVDLASLARVHLSPSDEGDA